MRQFSQGVIVGTAVSLLLVGSLSYAQSVTQQIEVMFLPLRYIFDGQEKAPPEDQKGFLYNGSTYVPLRFVTESLGKEVKWDGTNNVITIYSPENAASSRGETTRPVRINKSVQLNGEPFSVGSEFLARNGELFAPGAVAGELAGVKENASWDQQSQTMTYRRGDKTLEINASGAAVNGTKVASQGWFLHESRVYVSLRLVIEAFGGTYDEKAHSIHVTGIPVQKEVRFFLFQFNDGKKHVLSPPGFRGLIAFDGERLYPSLAHVASALAVENGFYEIQPTDLPTVDGAVVISKGVGSFEWKYVDPTRIDSPQYRIYTVTNPSNGASVRFDSKGTEWESKDANHTFPFAMDEILPTLGMKGHFTYDSESKILTYHVQQ